MFSETIMSVFCIWAASALLIVLRLFLNSSTDCGVGTVIELPGAGLIGVGSEAGSDTGCGIGLTSAIGAGFGVTGVFEMTGVVLAG